MIERLEELLEKPIFLAMAQGATFAVAFIFLCVAIGAGICVFCSPIWLAWLLLFIFSGLVSGTAFGVGIYLVDEY